MNKLEPTTNIITELGLRLDPREGGSYGEAEVRPETCLPATSVVRASVLATWADVITGLLAALVSPRIPLTADLEVQVQNRAEVGTTLAVEAEAVKMGRTLSLFEARFFDAESRRPVAFSYVSFVNSPDPAHVFAPGAASYPFPQRRLAIPLADRVQSRTLEPGTIEMPRLLDGLNATGAIQGGLVAFAAEQAALSLVDAPTYVDSLTIRYLRPFMTGPARAVATGAGGAVDVRLTDAGTGKLAAVATVRRSQ